MPLQGIILSSFTALLLLLLAADTVRRQRNLANWAFAAVLTLIAGIELADRLSLVQALEPYPIRQLSFPLQAALAPVLVLFSLLYSRKTSLRDIKWVWYVILGMTFLLPASLFVLLPEDFYYAPDFRSERMIYLGEAGYWFSMGVMMACVLSLVNIEATLSALSSEERWRIKFEVIGLVGMLAVLVFYYSQGLLYRSINAGWLPARSAVFIIAVVCIGYSRFFRGSGTRVVVSQFIVYRSMTLLAVGLYLVILGLIGEGMEHFEVPYHRALVMIIFFAAGMFLIAMMLSNRLRRRAKVLLSKHFLALKRDYRTEWLAFTDKLAACRTTADLEQAILTAYGDAYGFAGAALYLRDRSKNTFRLKVQTRFSKGVPEFEPGPSLCSYFLTRNRVWNPGDAEYRPAPEEASFAARSSASLVIPMVYGEQLEGLILLGSQLVPGELIYEDYDLMKIMARQAAVSLVSARLSEEITESREIAAVARVSSFVIHDLKNLASSLSLMLENTEIHMDDPEFRQDMIVTIRNSLAKMQRLIQRLRTMPEKSTLNIQQVDLDGLCRETLAEVSSRKAQTTVHYTGSPVSLSADGEEIRKVVLNLLLNAFEAVPAQGRVTLECGKNGTDAFIRVSDNGHGMTEEYMRDHLWRPFRTTKDKGLGIGLYQCRQIVEAHGGAIGVESGYGRGSVFTVRLPLENRQTS
jgi:hypothetical protein